MSSFLLPTNDHSSVYQAGNIIASKPFFNPCMIAVLRDVLFDTIGKSGPARVVKSGPALKFQDAFPIVMIGSVEQLALPDTLVCFVGTAVSCLPEFF